jgi:peptide/nickel transport system permease protein
MSIATAAGARAQPRRHGPWAAALRRLLRNRAARLGMAVVATFVVLGVLAPIISPYDPAIGSLTQSLVSPNARHWMGTDLQGRDEFSRILFGARLSLTVSISAVLTALIVGGSLGAIAGVLGGKADTLIMRVTDVLLAVPGILLAIGIVAWLGSGLPQITIAVGAANVAIFARLFRGSLLQVGVSDYVTAARAAGAGERQILVGHMLPNALTPLLVAAVLAMSSAIVDVAGLGYLGLGPADPSIAEWGTMLTTAAPYLRTAPYLILFPSVAIVLAAISFNLVGDGLREALDPRLMR